MKLPSQTLPYNFLHGVGFIPNAQGVKTQLAYWIELCEKYGTVGGLTFAFPIVFHTHDKIIPSLAESILERNDAVQVEFKRLLKSDLAWVEPMIDHWWPTLVPNAIPIAPPREGYDAQLQRELRLAMAFQGKGMRYAIARHLATTPTETRNSDTSTRRRKGA